MASERNAHRRALAEFVAEHRDQIEKKAGSDGNTAWLADAILEWGRADARTDGGLRR